MNAIEVATEGSSLEVTAAAYGGDTRSLYVLAGEGTQVISVTANSITAAQPAAGSTPSTENISVDLSSVQERIRVVEAAKSEGPRLEDAEIIVAGGRGLGSVENYKLIRELADGLGGMTGASRAIVDDGWASFEQQVGLTGKIVTPDVYFAIGISGASQHMAGCATARCIVAVNTDPDAPIFKFADYGIVDDALEVLPELVRLARERA